MKKDASFVQYIVEDLFGYMSDISARAMFGGYGIYRSGIMFALVFDGQLYFKVSDKDVEKYKAFGGSLFSYTKNGKTQEMGYCVVPEHIQEDKELFRTLSEAAYDYALEKSVKKRK